MAEFSMRYIVVDVDEAVNFYTRHLGFELVMKPGPGFAMLRREGVRLLVNAPEGGGGAGQRLSGGELPQPGGWNRFQVRVDDLAAVVDALRRAGVLFRGEVIEGRGGRQALAVDPSGNLVELFQVNPG
ncbi:VOC family protein [Mycolicibacterium gilvum]|uniref:Glyoxalase/Bleomycin resistance protein/Dioxygenase superfamily n=1 Tax=Mycolicibacterium gilvum (strain DSM 45189 / LMG 24558 / Spyr1) TaxID=278137 RepID=E6TP37_MYCSR|nr:VOC family protein [Mycolicibacterium gilvum]ADT99470.1 Glyoxalase/Bleomycin resistance protein/Dioxygenase superfamily [Mycolicibacterium gilvum Spyr1]